MAEQNSATMPALQTQQARINIVALGRTGEGKSALLNSILRYCGHKYDNFEEKADAFSVTKEIQEKSAVMSDGRAIRTIDTIGFFDTENTLSAKDKKKKDLIAQAAGTLDEDQQVVLMKLMQIIQLCPDGIQCFLVVVGVGRITRELKETFQLIIDYFGKHLLQYCIFVFTKIDTAPEFPHTQMRKGVEKCLQDLGISHSIEDQCVFINNREQNPDKIKLTMENLFNAIDHNLMRNGGQPYLNIFFEEAQKQMKEQKAQIRAEVEAKYQKDLEQKLKPIQEHHTKQMTEMKSKMDEELAQIKGEDEDARKEMQQQHQQQLDEADRRHIERVQQLETKLAEEASKDYQTQILGLEKAIADSNEKNTQLQKQVAEAMQELERMRQEGQDRGALYHVGQFFTKLFTGKL